MPYFNNQETKLYYISKGQGYPVFFLHGYLGSTKTHWRYQFIDPALSSSYHLIGLDIRGFGRSATETSSLQKSSMIIQDIRILLTQVLQLHSNPILVGYSVGATFALLYSLAFQKNVKALLLLSPMPFFPREISSRNVNSPRNNNWITKIILANVWAFVKKGNMIRQSPHIQRYLNSPPTIITKLKHLQLPILMVYGKNDTVINGSGFEMLIKYLPSHTKIISLPTDHGISHENYNVFNRILLHFLKEVL
ncbi:MAG: alpha/beta fold hydrolase [Candidatus Hodarchaeota archaeon]